MAELVEGTVMGVKAGIAVHATQGDDAKKVEDPPLPKTPLT